MPELQTPRMTSLNPLEIFRCLRLKVWDVEAQRMVGLRQLVAVPLAVPVGVRTAEHLRPPKTTLS
jgi:hypothetical protein